MSDPMIEPVDDANEAANDSDTVEERKDSTPTAKKKNDRRQWKKLDLTEFYEPPPVGKGEHNVERTPFRKREDEVFRRQFHPMKGDMRRTFDDENKGKGKNYKGGKDGNVQKGKGFKGKSSEEVGRSDITPATGVSPPPIAAPIPTPVAVGPVPTQSPPTASNYEFPAKNKGEMKGPQPAQSGAFAKGKKGKEKGKGKDRNVAYNAPRKGKGSWDNEEISTQNMMSSNGASMPRQNKGPNQVSQPAFYVQPAVMSGVPQNAPNYAYYYIAPGNVASNMKPMNTANVSSTSSSHMPQNTPHDGHARPSAPVNESRMAVCNPVNQNLPQQQQVYYHPMIPMQAASGSMAFPTYYALVPTGDTQIVQPVQQVVVPLTMYPQQVSPQANVAVPVNQEIQQQVEYYFGNDNLNRPDMFLRRQMDPDGYVSIQKLLDFNRMKRFATNIATVVTSLALSHLIELDSTRTKIRRRGDWEQWIVTLPDGDGSPRSSTRSSQLERLEAVQHFPHEPMIT